MKAFEDLTNVYSLSKTLRFELKPMGKTLEFIERKGLIEQDERRAEDYKIMKDIIDRYHKNFINDTLGRLRLKLQSDGNFDSLEEYVSLASIIKRDDKENANYDNVRMNLRKQITDSFKQKEAYSFLFKKELILQYLPDFVTDPEERNIVESFGKFTTYFSGFHKNRKNMYSDEEKSTAIAYRLIHENLPTFLDNLKSFAKIAESDIADYFIDIEQTFADSLDVKHIADLFQLSNFTETLTQRQISIYNDIIDGKVEEGGVKIKGINEYVNLYNQKHKDQRLPLLKPLYKMILSDRIAASWLPEKFESDEEMLRAIDGAIGSLKEILSEGEYCLRNILMHIKDYDTDHIYISNDLGLTNISQQLFGRYDVYTKAIKDSLRAQISPTPKEKREPEKFEERLNKTFSSFKSFSISYLNSLVENSEKTIEQYFLQLGAYDREGEQKINLFSQIDIAQYEYSNQFANIKSNINNSEENIQCIKKLLDAYKYLQNFIKPLLGSGDEIEKDNEFDAYLRKAWIALEVITPLYDKVRNWLTRKPYSTEKIKLNFENAQLLGGWDANKETDYNAILLRKGPNYYLAIMDKTFNREFSKKTLPSEGDCYEKIVYKLIPGANKMLPHVFLLNLV